MMSEKASLLLVNTFTDEDGTGCVHTAPGHGVEDFNVCLKYGIKLIVQLMKKVY